MKMLEERILKDGKIKPGNVLKVDGFINHNIDVPFVYELGREFYRRFKDDRVTKILTIEASGIGIACLTAMHFGVPVVFAKKSRTSNLSKDVYTARVDSFTHGTTCDIIVSKDARAFRARPLRPLALAQGGGARLCEVPEADGVRGVFKV